MEYGELALFRGITNSEVDAMIHCFHMRQARYESGQTICTYGEGGGEVGVLIRGHAALVRYDYAGTRTILEQIGTGGVFGEVLAFTPELGDCVEVVSGGESEALFMEYGHLMKRCENACAHHSRLVQNMFQLVTEQTRRLSRFRATKKCSPWSTAGCTLPTAQNTLICGMRWKNCSSMTRHFSTSRRRLSRWDLASGADFWGCCTLRSSRSASSASTISTL